VQREGGLKKMMLLASRTVIAMAKKTEGWKAGEGGAPQGETPIRIFLKNLIRIQLFIKKYFSNASQLSFYLTASPISKKLRIYKR